VADGDAEVHLTTREQASPHGAIRVRLAPAGAQAYWNGSQAGMLRISGRAADMRTAARRGDALVMRYRVDLAPQAPVSFGVRCAEPLCGTEAGAMLDATKMFRSAVLGTWNTLAIPLACLDATGANLDDVVAPFALATSGRFELTIAEVRVMPMSAGTNAPCFPAAGSIN
jgi:beta-glucosidase